MTQMKQFHNELTKLKKQKDRLQKRIDCVVQSNAITLTMKPAKISMQSSIHIVSY